MGSYLFQNSVVCYAKQKGNTNILFNHAKKAGSIPKGRIFLKKVQNNVQHIVISSSIIGSSEKHVHPLQLFNSQLNVESQYKDLVVTNDGERQQRSGTELQEVQGTSPMAIEENTYAEITTLSDESSQIQYDALNLDKSLISSNRYAQYVTEYDNVRQENITQNIYYITPVQLTPSTSNISQK
ncbi:hypothetical protein CHS0354_003197 [Potamilus streckersoni]|uniref:Uncharacterized protein n=1 Tax=Potamilus streckersoni TaxID=2493646 RepID=A0AAE0SIW1_9BIVA|nr:hypothetical protein CHS0354_003197 [Potamilus streckersoni]